MTIERVVARAPAKINWTLEVLGKREDGYHEVRTELQTIDLCDTVMLTHADSIELEITGDCAALADEPVEDNLAYRAAALLMDRCGYAGGVRIALEKRIPVAAGLGGGSSDAAAVLRGLRALWQLDLTDDDLIRTAADLGSDVPFFVFGGRARATGRGEQIQPLPDAPPQEIVIGVPPGRPAGKTARMYAALRAEHMGPATAAGGMYNAFAQVLAEVDNDTATLMRRATRLTRMTPHLCGAGPSFFFLVSSEQVAPTAGALVDLGLRAIATRTVTAAEATALSIDG